MRDQLVHSSEFGRTGALHACVGPSVWMQGGRPLAAERLPSRKDAGLATKCVASTTRARSRNVADAQVLKGLKALIRPSEPSKAHSKKINGNLAVRGMAVAQYRGSSQRDT